MSNSKEENWNGLGRIIQSLIISSKDHICFLFVFRNHIFNYKCFFLENYAGPFFSEMNKLLQKTKDNVWFFSFI